MAKGWLQICGFTDSSPFITQLCVSPAQDLEAVIVAMAPTCVPGRLSGKGDLCSQQTEFQKKWSEVSGTF